jgi:CBS domain-containing protein
MERNILVGDAMTTSPVTCTGDMTLVDVAKLMSSKKVGSILVVKEKRVIGIITEKDYIERVVAKDVNPAEATVQEYMTKDITTISPDIDILEAMNMMKKKDLRRMPVVEDKSLKGMLTFKDILKIQPELYQLMNEMMELREARRKPLRELEDPVGEYERVMDENWDDN